MDNSTAEVVFTFDGDEAGQKAALRAFEDDQKFAAETSIAITPGGMDPCELRLAEGDAAVQRLIDTRTPLFAFALRSIVGRYNLDTDEGRVAAVDAAVPVVAAIKNQALRDRYAIRLVGMAGIATQSEEQSMIRRVRAMSRARAAGGAAPERGRPARGRTRSRRPPPPRRADPGSICAAPRTGSSASCSSSPSSTRSWSPRPSTPMARTSSPARRTPRYAG